MRAANAPNRELAMPRLIEDDIQMASEPLLTSIWRCQTPSSAKESETLRRPSLALGAAAASSLAMLLGIMGAPSAQARAQGGGGQPSPQVNVWITTANGQQKLSRQAPVAFSTHPPADLTVTVDPTRTFQAMTGFGGSLTDSSAAVLYSLSPSARDAAMHLLFDPATGDGLDFLRQPIGAS